MLQLVGAGLGRTGTTSLKEAIEKLLGVRCFHMMEVFGDPGNVPLIRAATEGQPDWDRLLDGYGATVDWPLAGFWEPLAEANPDAIILLSTRADAETWWRSASATIFGHLGADPEAFAAANPEMADWRWMWEELATATFTRDYLDPDAAMAAYEAHNAHVRATADPGRLAEWQPGDGWEPLCAALGVAVPSDDFPHRNTTEEWVAARG